MAAASQGGHSDSPPAPRPTDPAVQHQPMRRSIILRRRQGRPSQATASAAAPRLSLQRRRPMRAAAGLIYRGCQCRRPPARGGAPPPRSSSAPLPRPPPQTPTVCHSCRPTLLSCIHDLYAFSPSSPPCLSAFLFTSRTPTLPSSRTPTLPSFQPPPPLLLVMTCCPSLSLIPLPSARARGRRGGEGMGAQGKTLSHSRGRSPYNPRHAFGP